MRRRTAIAAAGASLATLAAGSAAVVEWLSIGNGASPLTSRLAMSEVSDSELPREVFYRVPAYKNQTFSRILEGDTTTQAEEPPFTEEQKIVYQHGIYELSYERLDETPAIEYGVRLDIPETDGVPEDESIQYDDLPAVDRQKIGLTRPAQRNLGIGTAFVYTDIEREQSVLVPESEYSYITWDNGAAAEWIVDDARDTTLYTYDYTATQVTTTTEYGRQMREESAFELSGLSEPQRDIVETAIADAAYIGPPYYEQPANAFTALVDRFRGQKLASGQIPENPGGAYIVRYQGSVYWTRLDYYDGTLTPQPNHGVVQ